MKEECPLKKKARQFAHFISQFPGETETERAIQELQLSILEVQAEIEEFRRSVRTAYRLSKTKIVGEGDNKQVVTKHGLEKLLNYLLKGSDRCMEERIKEYQQQIDELRSSIQTAA